MWSAGDQISLDGHGCTWLEPDWIQIANKINRARGNGFRLCHGRLKLDVRNNFFLERGTNSDTGSPRRL